MRHPFRRLFVVLTFGTLLCASWGAAAEDGYQLWLRYQPLPAEQRALLPDTIVAPGADSPVRDAARAELQRGLLGLADKAPAIVAQPRARTLMQPRARTLMLARGADLPAGLDAAAAVRAQLAALGPEGYLVQRAKLGGRPLTLIAANTDAGLLYGSFAWLRALQTGTRADRVALTSKPTLPLRLLNHWDNLDRSVERGYAGQSIWNWWELPEIVDPRYTDYARANASLGINGTVLNNVNAKAEVLGAPFIAKAAAVADVLRPYGIRVFLSVRWSSPLELKETTSADPLAPDVAAWWKAKADEIYRTIPDFGGFLVKANSEGQPGPQDYRRNHADGANMLARALAPHQGIVMWRAFVYASPEESKAGKTHDRAVEAYDQFVPLDGKFDDNVLVQVKNGAIDFQPREPVHPLFGAMPATPLVMEFQITKEYLGFATHLAYLAPMFEETLGFDTRVNGQRLTVAEAVQGKQSGKVGGIAGVANIGASRNWSGSTFDQANWYAFGRMAWDQGLDSGAIAREWAAQTFGADARLVDPVTDIMLRSREAVVDYMTPLGLNHLMGSGHHYGPAPWVDNLERADWNPIYYHRAARDGIGFDRTASGSNAVAQYAPEVARRFASSATTPPELLLWFHRLPWSHRMPSQRTLWEELVARYDHGVAEAAAMQADWARLQGLVDPQRFADVAQRLAQQHREAQWWRDACLAYFQDVSGLPLPAGVRAPAQSLQYYRALRFPYAPGNG